MAHLSLSLLGPFQALLDDRPITEFESARARALLAYLAVEQAQPQRRDALVELFWPEQPSGSGLANLRHTLANLRKAIDDQHAAPPVLLVTSESIQFNPASDAFVDLQHFYSLLAHDPTPAALQEVMALYRGRVMDGFILDGSPDFELWLLVLRERVDSLIGHALARLVRIAVQQADFTQALHWTERQLALDPLNEDVQMQHVWLLAHSGQRSAALRQYELARLLLQKELDVEPQEAMQSLVARIRAGSHDLGVVYGQDGKPLVLLPPPSAPVTQAAPTPTIHLPTPPTPFIGRERELALVAERLADPACRLLTIVGPGGMGKTRLAIQSAAASQEHFPDGVFFVELTAVGSTEQMPAVILSALGAPRGGLDLRRHLLETLRLRRMLLVLDNFEHLLEGADLLVELAQAAPLVKVLATSRARLNLREEWLLPLEGLDLPPAADGQVAPAHTPALVTADLESFDASRLFLHCARRLQPTFHPSPGDIAAILHICRLLDGLPLGIELAATWVRSAPLHQIAHEIEHGLSFLSTSLRNIPTRHRSMSAVFDHSWRLLGARQRTILRQLSVFRGGCSGAAAEAVAGATLGDLAGLVDASWLRLRGDGRYEMHELMRQYCEEKLDAEHDAPDGQEGDGLGEPAEEVRRRHCVYYANMVGAEDQALNWRAEPVAIFRADFGNLQAAWRWAVEHGDLVAMKQMLIGLTYFADMTGRFAAMLPFFERAADAVRTNWHKPEGDADQRQGAALLLVFTLYFEFDFSLKLGQLERASACLNEMRAILAVAEHDDRWQEHDVMTRWCVIFLGFAQGEFDAVYAASCDLLEFTQNNDFPFYPWSAEIGVRFALRQTQGFVASSARLLGDYPTSWEHIKAACDLSEEMGEERFRATDLTDMAVLLQLQGDYDEAREMAQRGLALSQSFDDILSTAYAELTLGQIEIDAGRYTLAGEYCRRALAVAQETDVLALHVASLVALARIERLLGHHAAARRRLAEALNVCTQPGVTHTNFLPTTLVEMGHLACAEQDWPQARQQYTEALAMKGLDAAEVLDALSGLAKVAWAENAADRANQLLDQVIGNPATSAATRRRAENLRATWRAG
jgi:predicted ATPase/DNA-binding SARP family transcriptional activator